MSSNIGLAAAEAVAVLAAAGVFVVCAISYMRAVNGLSSHLDIEKLNAMHPTRSWLLRLLFIDFYASPRKFFGEGHISDLVLGLRVLNHSDERSRQLLWLARKRLIICLFLFLAGVIAVSWLFKNSKSLL